jgi:hypothetical protein
MKIVDVFPTAYDPAILEFEDNTAVNIELLAVSHPAVMVDADNAAFIIRKYILKFGLEGAFSLAAIAPELGKDSVAAYSVAGDRALSRRVPGSVLIEEFHKSINVGLIESPVTAAYNLSVFEHFIPPFLF